MEQVKKDEPKDVVLVDIYNLIYRAYHGNMSNLKAPDGTPTAALFTVIKMLKKLPQQFSNLEFSLAVFDGGGNFRKDLDAEYKSNRKPMPDDLKIQMPLIKEAMRLMGWPMHQAEGVEADDVMSTLAVRAASKGYKVYIVSGDKDFRQIVGENINVIDTMQDILYDRNKVIEKMGVPPEQIRDYLALCGDGADNVKGVDKAGPKTVVKWLTQYGDIDGIIAHKDEIKGVVGDNLRKEIDNGNLLLWRQLVTVKADVEIQLKCSELTMQPEDSEGLQDFYKKMDFKSMMKKSPQP
jgi:DNA polymerase I